MKMDITDVGFWRSKVRGEMTATVKEISDTMEAKIASRQGRMELREELRDLENLVRCLKEAI
jgi:hypothetical protein